jgi:predicted TPR repeat methyltransferase
VETINYTWDIDNPLTYKNRMGFYKTRTELAFIKKYIPKDKRLKILDIGGGSGRFAISLTDDGHNVTLIDKSREAISLCHKKGLLKAICADVLEFQSSEKYDLSIAIEVIEYFNDFPGLLNKIRKISNDNSMFIFTVYNKNSWRSRLRNIRKHKTEYKNLKIIDYIKELNSCGFRLIKIQGFLWMPFQLSSNSIMIPLFEKIEKMFRLDLWIRQSPWVMIAAEKN